MANPASADGWCSRGLIITVSGPGESKISVRVPRPFVRIGSDRRAEVSLSEGDLLPCHLYLHATEHGIYCLGLSDLAPSGWLTSKIRVEIGPYRIKAAFDDALAPPLAGSSELRKKGCPAGPVPYMRISDASGGLRPAELAIDRQLSVIGRRSPSSLRLGHKTVSRVHCVLYWTGELLWTIDLLSGNGTRLDGERIDAALWRPGCELAAGSFRMEYLRLQGPHQVLPIPNWSSPSRIAPAYEATGETLLGATREGGGFHPDDSVADSSPNLPSVAARLHCEDGDCVAADLGQDASAEPCRSADLDCAGCALDDASQCDEHRASHLSRPVACRPAEIQDGASAWASCDPRPRPSSDLVAPRRPGAVSPSIEGPLPALIEHTAAQAGSPLTAAADSAAALAEAMRQLTRGVPLHGPVQLIEQELSMVCLTLVQARQTAAEGSSLAAPEVDRLVGVIRDLERQLTQLARTNGPNPVLGSDRLGNAMPKIQSDAMTGPEGPPGGALEAVALPTFSNASCAGLGARNAERGLAPVRWSSPILKPTPPELTAGAEDACRIAAPAAPALDDRMLERLLNFKANRDSVTQRRRRLWCATAAIAVVLIVAITGAAKLWLNGQSLGQLEAQPSPSTVLTASNDFAAANRDD